MLIRHPCCGVTTDDIKLDAVMFADDGLRAILSELSQMNAASLPPKGGK